MISSVDKKEELTKNTQKICSGLSLDSNCSHKYGKTGNKLLRISSSTAVWAILLIVCFDIFIASVKPLRFVKIPGIILKDQDSVGDQVAYIKSGAGNSDILMFGTSLIRNASSYADGLNESKSFDQHGYKRYYPAHTFDAKLKSSTGLNAKTSTVMVGGGFFYDYWRLFRVCCDSGVKPKLVVFAIAPKDFADSTRTLEDSHVDLFLGLREKAIQKIVNFKTASEALFLHFWQFYKVKTDYHAVAQVFASSLFDRAPTHYAAVHEKDTKRQKISFVFDQDSIDLINPIGKEMLQDHHRYYGNVYRTAKQNNLNQQFQFLEKAIDLCKKQNIQCLIVNMPLSSQHSRLMPPNLRDLYLKEVFRICSKSNVKIINLMEDKRFPSSEFVDVVHLNAYGANRFWNILVDEVKNDDVFRNELVNRFVQ